jgi:uridine phosphorylase
MHSKKISEADLIIHNDGSAFHIGLSPSQVPENIIAVGDPDRVAMVSQYFDSIEFKVNNREFVSHGGIYNGSKILCISTGIGTDNVEIVLTELDALVNVDLETRLPKNNRTILNIVRVGTSGSMQSDVPVGSEVASVYGIGFDNLMNFYKPSSNEFEKKVADEIRKYAGLSFSPFVSKGSEKLFKQIAYDMVAGNTVTCPGFYAPQGRTVRNEIAYPNLIHDLSNYGNENFQLTNFEMETSAYYSLGNLLGHDTLSVSAILINRINDEVAKNSNELIDALIKKVLQRI